MPLVQVSMWRGRSREQKKKLIKSVTAAVAESISCPPESVWIIINDVDKADWGMAGECSADKFPDK